MILDADISFHFYWQKIKIASDCDFTLGLIMPVKSQTVLITATSDCLLPNALGSRVKYAHVILPVPLRSGSLCGRMLCFEKGFLGFRKVME